MVKYAVCRKTHYRKKPTCTCDHNGAGANIVPSDLFFSTIPKHPELIEAANRNDIKYLGNEFISRCIHQWRIDHFLGWYERELQTRLGVDLFSKPFNFEVGWSFIAHSKCPTLIMRSDLEDRKKEETIRKCFGYDITIRRSNEGSNKKLASVYENFKTEFKLPRDEFELIYATRMARHFFSPEEKSAEKRWYKY